MAKRHKSKRNRLTTQERRAKYSSARKDLSKLKHKGLVSPRANLRRAKPSSGLLKKLEILRPVLEGKAEAVKLKPAVRRDYKEAGYFTTRGFTVIHKNPYERVTISQEGLPELKPKTIKTGEHYLRRIVLPANVRRGDKFREWLLNDYAALEKLAPNGALFAFTFKGYNSRDVKTADEMFEYLTHYKWVFGDGDEEESTFEQLILYAMDYPTARDVWGPSAREQQPRRHFQPNAPLTEEGKQARRVREAARMRAYRATKKGKLKI